MKIIETYHADLLNGTGLREVLFFSGCEWKCKNCFNSFTWDPDCPQAHEWGEEDYLNLSKELLKDHIDGVTLSGGDPLSVWNKSEILDLVKRLKKDFPEKTIWCYTGYTWEMILNSKDEKKEILKYIDVLCEGQFVESLKSPKKKWVGSENQRVIDVEKSLKTKKIVLLDE